MKKLPLIARLLLGLIFFVFGLNGFLHFMPVPPMEGPKADYFAGLLASGYSLPLISLTQAASGLLLLIGSYVPLALVMLAPVIVNILLFHVFLDPAGLGIAVFVAVLEAYLAFFADPYQATIRRIFRRRA